MFMFHHSTCSAKLFRNSGPTQECQVIPIAPWWLSQRWFPHLLCRVDHPLFFHTAGTYCHNRDKSGMASRTVCMLEGTRAYYQAAGFSKTGGFALLSGYFIIIFFQNVYLQAVMKTSVSSIWKTGTVIATGQIVEISFWLIYFSTLLLSRGPAGPSLLNSLKRWDPEGTPP